MPVSFIELDADVVTSSTNLSLVLIVTFALASTIGLIPVTFALRPGNNYCSLVSSSASKFFPENIAALKFSSNAPNLKCPVVQ